MSEYIAPLWEDFNGSLETFFLPQPDFNFLNNKTIKSTMFVDCHGKWLDDEIKFLEGELAPETMKRLLEEDYVGHPVICSSKYQTSHNSIHHLYHLMRFQKKTGAVISRKGNSIVEWGGGYGNMAKIARRINAQVTYTIIDTPLFSCLQWLYLSSIFGDEAVSFITEKNNEIVNGQINILPVSLIRDINISAQMFIATWSLSESSKYAQQYVDSVNFFNAKHLLIAFQDSSESLPYASLIGDIVKAHGATVENIDFLPGNYYAFL